MHWVDETSSENRSAVSNSVQYEIISLTLCNIETDYRMKVFFFFFNWLGATFSPVNIL